MRKTISSRVVRPGAFGVLGVRVQAVDISQTIAQMEAWVRQPERCHTIAVTGMHGVVEARHDPVFERALHDADAIVPDGMPLIWLAKMQGFSLSRRVYGPELMVEFCKQTSDRGYRHFFYGSAPGVPESLAKALEMQFPKIGIAGALSPPFHSLTLDEEERLIDVINRANADILWVGLGTPKQELWMNRHRHRLRVPVAVGVGAAFDINSGRKGQAPRWMRENGLEWAFRLSQEPRRLWKRYILYGPEFIAGVALEFMGIGKPDLR